MFYTVLKGVAQNVLGAFLTQGQEVLVMLKGVGATSSQLLKAVGYNVLPCLEGRGRRNRFWTCDYPIL